MPLWLVVAVVLRALPAAASGAGTADPLLEGVGARERALGGGVVAARGVAALGWNPALLAATDGWAVHAHLSPLPEGASYEHAGVARGLGPGVVGVGFTRLGAGGIASFDAANIAGGELGFNDGELGVGYGVELRRGARAGALLRYRWQSLGEERAAGVGVDLGATLALGRWPWLELGTRLRGVVSPSLRLRQEDDRLPRSFDLGAQISRPLAGRPVRWIAASDLGTAGERFALGAEVAVTRDVDARFGMRSTGPRAGFGFEVGAFDLDYALESRDLGLVHGLSVTAHFGRAGDGRLEQARAEARAAGAAAARAEAVAEIVELRGRARRAEAAGDLEGARRLWLAYQFHNPDDDEARSALARLADLDARAYRDSLASALALAAVDARLTAAQRALDAGDLDAALELVEALEATPGASDDSRIQALARTAESQRRERVAALRREAHRLQNAGDDVEAVLVWSRLLTWEPGDTEAERAVAETRQRLDALERDHASQGRELDRLSLLVRALQAYGAEEYVLSESLVDSVLTADPESPTARELKRRLERRTAPPDTSVSEQARQIYIQGMRHFNAGRYADAITAWERLLEIQPDNDSVRRNIDEARARLGIEAGEE